MPLPDAVGQLYGKTVCVLVSDQGHPNSLRLRGTGFVVSTEGWIATCKHVVQEPGEYWIAQTDYHGGVHHLVKVDSDMVFSDIHDLALIHASRSFEGPVTLLHPGADLVVGEDVALIGYPEGAYSSQEGGLIMPNVRAGILSGIFRDRAGKWMMWIDAAVHPGNSGSPVFRARDGVVIGMITTARIDQPIPGLIIPRDLGQAMFSAAIVGMLDMAAKAGLAIGHWYTSP